MISAKSLRFRERMVNRAPRSQNGTFAVARPCGLCSGAEKWMPAQAPPHFFAARPSAGEICFSADPNSRFFGLYANSWGKTKMEKGRSSFRLLLFELND